MNNVLERCLCVGVQDGQYGNLLFAASVILATSIIFLALRFAFLQLHNYVLRLEQAILKVSIFMLELRVALMKAGVICEPIEKDAGDEAGNNGRGEGCRVKRHGSLLANGGNHPVRGTNNE